MHGDITMGNNKYKDSNLSAVENNSANIVSAAPLLLNSKHAGFDIEWQRSHQIAEHVMYKVTQNMLTFGDRGNGAETAFFKLQV